MIELRASSIPDFLDCPARAEAKHLLGKHTPSSPPAMIGTAIHVSTAAFDKSVLAGNPITISEAAGAAVDAIHRPNEDVEWDDESPQAAEDIALALHTKYCTTVAPVQVYAAVEVKCKRLEITDLGIALTGTTDRVRRTRNNGLGISDLKSGKTAVRADGHVETKGHTYQLGVYELLAEAASGLDITEPAQIIGLNTGKTEKAQRVATGEIEGGRDVLLGGEDHPGILATVARLVKEGMFFGNPKSMLCGEKYCPIFSTCHYRR